MVGVRTMEFCRRWGIVRCGRGARPTRAIYAQDNVYLTSLTGYELGRERFPGDAARRRRRSKARSSASAARRTCSIRSCAPSRRSQPNVDAALPHAARRLHASTPTASPRTVENADDRRARDDRGALSRRLRRRRAAVRETLGIAMEGKPVLTYTTNVIFRCPRSARRCTTRAKPIASSSSAPKAPGATIVAINGRDHWRMSIIGGSTQRELSRREEIAAAIRRAVGRDFEFEILSVMPWVRRELVAERYGDGRVFIAGDAAHVMSPTGGFGMNTGIGDAVDLSWKLAAMLEGWGGDGAAEFLQHERRPVGDAQRRRGERQPAPHALGPAPHPDAARRHAAGRGDARRSRAAIRRDDAPRMVHARHPSRLSLRRLADLLARRHAGAARRAASLRADRAARHRAPACLARRRALDARSVRPRLRAARFRRRRGRGSAAPRGGASSAICR